VLTLLAALMLGSMLLYVPLRAGRLIRSCATLAERHKPSMKHIATLGFWPAAIVVVSTAIPILCLMVARQVYVDW
jgi:hypothetical protein